MGIHTEIALVLKGRTITKEEAKDYCCAIRKLPLSLPTKKTICMEIRQHEQQEPIRIGYQHAQSLAEMVRYVKKLILSAGMEESVDRSDELTTAYCDELLEDLKQ